MGVRRAGRREQRWAVVGTKSEYAPPPIFISAAPTGRGQRDRHASLRVVPQQDSIGKGLERFPHLAHDFVVVRLDRKSTQSVGIRTWRKTAIVSRETLPVSTFRQFGSSSILFRMTPSGKALRLDVEALTKCGVATR